MSETRGQRAIKSMASVGYPVTKTAPQGVLDEEYGRDRGILAKADEKANHTFACCCFLVVVKYADAGVAPKRRDFLYLHLEYGLIPQRTEIWTKAPSQRREIGHPSFRPPVVVEFNDQIVVVQNHGFSPFRSVCLIESTNLATSSGTAQSTLGEP